MAYYKTQNYQEFKQSLRGCVDLLKKAEAPNLIVCSGSCEFFIEKAQATIIRTLTATSKQLADNIQSFEASEMTDETFKEAVFNSDLFSNKALVVIKRAELRNGFSQLLTSTLKNPVDNFLIISLGKSRSSAALKKALSKVKHFEIKCDEPARSESRIIINDLCKKARLNLSNDALNFIEQIVGGDLFKIENELEKLKLVFHEETRSLSKSDIAPLIPPLKDDLAFELGNYLITENFPRAMSFSSELIERGESPIALIGLLASHCRKCLKISEALKETTNPKLLSQMTGLQFFIVKRYTSYVRKTPPHVFKRGLEHCQRLEGLAKSSKTNPHLLVQGLVGEFMAN